VLTLFRLIISMFLLSAEVVSAEAHILRCTGLGSSTVGTTTPCHRPQLTPQCFSRATIPCCARAMLSYLFVRTWMRRYKEIISEERALQLHRQWYHPSTLVIPWLLGPNIKSLSSPCATVPDQLPVGPWPPYHSTMQVHMVMVKRTLKR